MNLKLILKEDDEVIETPEIEEQPLDDTSLSDEPEVIDNEPEAINEPEGPYDFIDSQELNSLRELLLDIPEDIELLLLNDNIIVIGKVFDGETSILSLPDEDTGFTLIDMPLRFEDIVNNENIIKYTNEGPDTRHEKVYEFFMQKLNPNTPKESITDTPEEPVTDTPKEDDDDVKED